MKIKLPENVTRTLGKAGLKLRKHSPEILLISGIVGVVVSAVMACKASTKVGSVVEDTKEKVEDIHERLENSNDEKSDYTEEDSKKDLSIVYLKSGLSFAKLYAPAVILGTLSIFSILASNNIMKKRNIALAAAYATIDNSFKDYRKRVVDRFGEEIDRQLKYNITPVEVEKKVVDENGEEKTVKEVVETIDSDKPSDYARFFDDLNEYCKKDPYYNKLFLQSVERSCNDQLRAKGYLFLNTVYRELGFDEIPEGQYLGWIYDPEDPTCHNCVDFHLYDIENKAGRKFINGNEYAVLLDFNIDGDILSQM